jgi:SAM-dependent methyltransferase
VSDTQRAALVNELYRRSTASGRLFGPEYYGEFLNWGYWKSDTRSQREACENLVDLVLQFVPEKRGKVLEAGCGVGGVAKKLTEHWRAEDVLGINTQAQQLRACEALVPGARFAMMDAAKLELSDRSFGAVISVEAAFHFDTRERFLREALRVLQPGGYLAMADIIGVPYGNRSNLLRDPGELRALLSRVGFCEIRIEDVTEDTAHAHADHALAHLALKRTTGAVTQERFDRAALSRAARLLAGRYYVVLGARRPVEPLPAWRTEVPGINAYVEGLLAATAHE